MNDQRDSDKGFCEKRSIENVFWKTAGRMVREELRQVVAVIRALVAAIFRALTLVPAPLVAEGHKEIVPLTTLMLNTITQLFILITLILPPAQVDLPLRDRLFYDFHGHEFQGRDLFSLISQQRYLFG